MNIPFRYLPFKIANGQTESDIHDVTEQDASAPVAMEMPAAFTGTTITFKGSNDGTTFRDLYNSSGVQISVTVAANRIIMLNPSDFAGIRKLKIVSGAAEGGDRTVNVTVRPI